MRRMETSGFTSGICAHTWLVASISVVGTSAAARLCMIRTCTRSADRRGSAMRDEEDAATVEEA